MKAIIGLSPQVDEVAEYVRLHVGEFYSNLNWDPMYGGDRDVETRVVSDTILFIDMFVNAMRYEQWNSYVEGRVVEAIYKYYLTTPGTKYVEVVAVNHMVYEIMESTVYRKLYRHVRSEIARRGGEHRVAEMEYNHRSKSLLLEFIED